MAQRSFFWPRHGGNAAPNRENNDNNSNSTGYSGPTEHSGGSQTLAALEAHQHQHQHRQPGNSTGGAGASSFASSHSSSHSPSPSPSIDPYASAVRSMLADAARQTADSSVPRLSAGAGAGATLPANLRRASRTHSESAPLPPSPLLLEGRAWGGGPVPQQQKAWSRMSQDQPQASVAAVAHAQTSAAAASAPAPVLASSSVAPHGSRDTRCEQIVQNFYAKTAQVIAHLRGGGNGGDAEAGSSTMYASSASSSVADVGATGRRINKWFSMSLEDVGDAREEAKFWRNAVAATSGTHQHQQQQSQQPPPMIIEVCLDVSGVQPDDELQVADVAGRPWSVDLELAAPSASRPQHLDAGYRRRARATAVVLESWRLDLDVGAIPLPVPDLPRVYKKAIVFFRSLYAYASLLPCAATAQQQQQSHSGAGRRQQLPVFCVFRTEASPRARTIDLGVGLTGTDSFLGSHTFEPVATPMGAFAMSVQYRRECSFACAGPHSPAQHDALGTAGTADDTYFTPTLSSRSGSHFSAGRASRLHTRPDDHASYANYANYANQTSSSGERGLAVPSVNPFRARPLSMGSSAMLGAAGNGGGGRRNSVVEPMFVTHSHDPHAHPASLPRHVGGYGFSFGGSGSGSRMRAASVAAGAHVSRPHSLDQRAEAILGRLSTSAATDSGSGSTLHRSVMLRRLGDSLSPSESHRSADAGLRVSAAAAPETHGSPPRIGLPGARTIPISATGRSTLGVTPFKSPSLSESPAPRFVSTFADDSGDHET
ncbi:autophagy protein 13, partial [Coemansia sp. RSA 2049]